MDVEPADCNVLKTLVPLTTDLGYVAQVKGTTAAVKKLALDFRRLNRMDLAKRALQHVKIMSDEVAEVENAMAGGAAE